jgi:hypothetical protein
MPQETWNREELYEKVWSRPVVKVAEEYGVSDVAIAKVCRKLKVPVPGRGYWAKKEHGHPVSKKPLPKLSETVVVTRSTSQTTNAAQAVPELHKDDQTEFARIDQLLQQGSFAFVTSPKALRHPLLVATRAALREGSTDERKIQNPSYRSRSLNIRVAKNNVSRALEFMASLIATAENSGGGIEIRETDRHSETYFVAYGERVEIRIYETAHQNVSNEPKPQRGSYYSGPTLGGKPIEYTPTGKMIFEVSTYGEGLRKNWNEGKQTVAEYHPAIVATLFKAAVLRRRTSIQREEERKAQERRQQELAILRKRIEEEEVRVRRLEQDADNWAKAKKIREYVLAVVEEKKKLGDELGPDTPLGIWASWALQQADRLDPMVKSPSSILDRKKELPREPEQYRWR